MKSTKLVQIWIGLLAFFTITFFINPAQAELKVVTTVPDLAAITQEIGGHKVKVQSIAKGYQDPHFLEAKPSYMVQLNQADLLIYTGLQLEIGWLPLLIQGARNPAINLGGKGNLDASRAIRVLEVPTGEVDRSMGDVHPEGNPHYLLDPRNGIIVGQEILDRLKLLSPKDSAYFESNFKNFQDKLTTQIADWEKRMAPFKGTQVVSYHKLFEYLMNWLGFSAAGYIEEKPGIPPTAKHLAFITELIKEKKIKIILNGNYTDPKIAQLVADKSGAKLVILPAAVGGEEGIDTYPKLFERIISKLETEFKQLQSFNVQP
ncbi:MAG TPA: zinc ABC transporter substrate-binding protein [Candidatus Limnocylindrales bacterium]|nr:zinc ABC transporter substrate-binding protein [Candidatus Limnocylindrales bacterium]